ncbi:MAG: ketopantoate reductase family protein [Candidatus Cloacimonetes bacterium]|nr:ketopantoate reductase family protein [Candidatus Cloacimonadota bacterium]
MNNNNYRYIIYGAGAVGSTVGGLLALSGKEAVLVGRKEHIEKIDADGLILNSYDESLTVNIPSFCSLTDFQPQENDVIVLCVKSQDTIESIEDIRKSYAVVTPVISLQNSVLNEPEIAKYFPNCYGGVFRMTSFIPCTGSVNYRKTGRIILGRYPSGTDDFIISVESDLADAGFDTDISMKIMNDKWLKLALNVTSVATGIFSNQGIDRNLTNRIKIKLLDELETVLWTADIDTTPCCSKDKTIGQMINHFGKPAKPYEPKIPVYNSTWAGLQKGDRLETSYFLGVIIDLARQYGISVPIHTKISEMSDFLEKNKLNQEYFQQKDIEEILNKEKGDRRQETGIIRIPIL